MWDQVYKYYHMIIHSSIYLLNKLAGSFKDYIPSPILHLGLKQRPCCGTRQMKNKGKNRDLKMKCS